MGILSHTFPVKNQTNLVMMNIFLYQDHSFFKSQYKFFTHVATRCFCGSLWFCSISKATELWKIFVLPLENCSHFYILLTVFFLCSSSNRLFFFFLDFQYIEFGKTRHLQRFEELIYLSKLFFKKNCVKCAFR